MKRTDKLMTRELDGDLSVVDSVELERAEWTDSDIRRTRQAWLRTKAAFEELTPPTPQIPLDQWAARIHAESCPPRPLLLRWLGKVFSAGDSWQARWAMGASGLAMTAFLISTFWPAVPPRPSSLGHESAWTAPAAPLRMVAPVEIRVSASRVEEADDSPVSIRF